MFKQEEGFTLIEMIIVLAIITVLLVLVVPNLANQNKDVHERGNDAIVQMANNQVQAYYIDKGRYPSEISDLVEADYLRDIKLNNGEKLVFESGKSDPPVVIIANDES